MPVKVIGKNPAGARLDKIKKSPNYKNGTFQNIEPTEVTLKNASTLKLLREFLTKPKTVKPAQDIPFIQTDLKNIQTDTPVIIWFGHSSYFIKSRDFTILVDPVLSGSASPFSFMVKAFAGANNYAASDFPPIDLLLITHDHYDHLNYPTILQLQDRVKQIVTPLGVGAHLEHWGIPISKITELDWWEQVIIAPDINLAATPARHFSGRGITRNKTLWASYVLQLHHYKLFLGGDSGYDAQFQKMGARFGPFDLAILESGQYGQDWPYIHMLPEETVQAAVDLKAKVLLPVHWGKFVLALHPWNEPIKRIMAAAATQNMKVVTPKIGDIYRFNTESTFKNWWDIDE